MSWNEELRKIEREQRRIEHFKAIVLSLMILVVIWGLVLIFGGF